MIILFCFQYLPAQGEETVEGELSIWVKNNSQLKLVSMTLELVSIACWDEDHNLTELFTGGTESGYINNGWLEFLCCWETSPQNYYRTFGLGLYKVTAKVNGVAKHHFFIDYRTASLPGLLGQIAILTTHLILMLVQKNFIIVTHRTNLLDIMRFGI